MKSKLFLKEYNVFSNSILLITRNYDKVIAQHENAYYINI